MPTPGQTFQLAPTLSRPSSPPNDSSTSSPTYTFSSSSLPPSASRPDSTSSPEPDGLLTAEQPKEFKPAPAFSLAKAPRYPGWNPSGPPRHSTIKINGQNSTNPTSPSSANALSPDDASPRPFPSTRFPPAKPLSPNHLARIANALGVQVPTLHGRATSSNTSNLPVDRRPSSANSNRSAPVRVNSATRFLLYVVPPSHLSPELSGNAGLANQFRRGSLLPLHATLPSQLAAIAREYSMPSTTGLVVYLLDVKHDIMGEHGIGEEWLGPRIGDDAWRLLWAGMLRAEREEFERTMALNRQMASPMLTATPALPISQSSPSFPTNPQSSPPESESGLPIAESPTPGPPKLAGLGLRPLLVGQNLANLTRSASPAFKSAERSNTMRSDSPSASSVRSTTTAVSTLLPSLPIVGKIEFDVDRTKATWYDAWVARSRSRAVSTSGAPMRASPIPLQLTIDGPTITGTGKLRGKKLPPSPLLPVSPSLDVEAAKASSNLLTPASATFPSAETASDVSEYPSPEQSEQNSLPRNSLQLETRDGVPVPLTSSENLALNEEVGGEEGYEQLEDQEDSQPEVPEAEEVLDDEDAETPAEEELEDDPAVRIRGDPLGDVFPPDAATWSDIHNDLSADSSLSGHDMSNGYISRSSEESDFTEDIHIPSGTDDFQEVLDLLNSKNGFAADPSVGEADLSLGAFPPSQPTTPGLVLRSPIILDPHHEPAPPSSPDAISSPASLTSGESARHRRPTPLIIGPTDKIPSILEGLQPTPPPHRDLSPSGDPRTPQPRINTSNLDLDDDLDMDEFAQEQAMQRQLDELERSISSLSPRELAPTPVYGERSPSDRGSRKTTPTSAHLSGFGGGHRFRSEALGAELASKMASNYGGDRSSSPSWPAVPFERGMPSSPHMANFAESASAISEETRTRSRLLAEEEELSLQPRRRPPTPAARKIDNDATPVSVVTAVPPRVSSLPSPKGSRFSADSVNSEDVGRSSVVGRSLRKLWRKSGAAAQATVRLNAQKQSKASRGDSPPPLPSKSQQVVGSRPESRSDRPDSSQDPFYLDKHSSNSQDLSSAMAQQSRASQVDLKPATTLSISKTRSILKGRRTSPPNETRASRNSGLPQIDERANSPSGLGLLPSRRTNIQNLPASPPENNSDLSIRIRKSPPSVLDTTIGPPMGHRLFPRTASSRSSFEVDETTYRPSMDSGDPLTPRLSQFEIVSPPPPRPFELDDERQPGWPRP